MELVKEVKTHKVGLFPGGGGGGGGGGGFFPPPPPPPPPNPPLPLDPPLAGTLEKAVWGSLVSGVFANPSNPPDHY